LKSVVGCGLTAKPKAIGFDSQSDQRKNTVLVLYIKNVCTINDIVTSGGIVFSIFFSKKVLLGLTTKPDPRKNTVLGTVYIVFAPWTTL